MTIFLIYPYNHRQSIIIAIFYNKYKKILFNKCKYVSFCCGDKHCIFVSSMKENGGETKECGNH